MVIVPLLVREEPRPEIVTALLDPDTVNVTPLLTVTAQLKPASAIGVELLLETITGQTTADAYPETKLPNTIDKLIFRINFNLLLFT